MWKGAWWVILDKSRQEKKDGSILVPPPGWCWWVERKGRIKIKTGLGWERGENSGKEGGEGASARGLTFCARKDLSGREEVMIILRISTTREKATKGN